MEPGVDVASRRAAARDRCEALRAQREADGRLDEGLVRARGDAHRDLAVVALRADGIEAARPAVLDAVDWRLRLVDRLRARDVSDENWAGVPDRGWAGVWDRAASAGTDDRPDGSPVPLEEALWLACTLADPTVVRPVAREVLAAAPDEAWSAPARVRCHRARYAALVASPDAAAVTNATPPVPGTAGDWSASGGRRRRRTSVDAAARAARESLAAWARTAPLDGTTASRQLLLGLDGLVDRDGDAVAEAVRRRCFDHARGLDDPPATADLVCLPAAALVGIARLVGLSVALDAPAAGIRTVLPEA